MLTSLGNVYSCELSPLKDHDPISKGLVIRIKLYHYIGYPTGFTLQKRTQSMFTYYAYYVLQLKQNDQPRLATTPDHKTEMKINYLPGFKTAVKHL